jgi:hypothetical protein
MESLVYFKSEGSTGGIHRFQDSPVGCKNYHCARLYGTGRIHADLARLVGTRYLPFIFLYGMWEFAILAAILIFGSVGIVMLLPDSFTFGGWFTAIVLLLFGFIVQFTSRNTQK